MSIKEDAIREMKAAEFTERDIEAMNQILTIFFNHWDSGGAVWAMVPVLMKCLTGLPLSPLTGNDDEWLCGHFQEGMCRNEGSGTCPP